jgi:hypothetical protein
MFRNSNESVPDQEAGVQQLHAGLCSDRSCAQQMPDHGVRIVIYFLLVLFSSETLFQCLVYLVFIVSIFLRLINHDSGIDASACVYTVMTTVANNGDPQK